jgi:hypothetical protein
MWILWSLPLRSRSWWGWVLGLLGTGWFCSWALPWFTPLSTESASALRDNWAFLTRAVLGAWLVVWSTKTSGWVRTLSEGYLLCIFLSSIFLLPLAVSAGLAWPSLGATLHWALASLGGLALTRSGLRAALAGWLFAVLVLLSPVGEGDGWHLSGWVLGLILILAGSFWRNPSHQRPTP